jgi:DNA-binding CsgD family transcriptional regulator
MPLLERSRGKTNAVIGIILGISTATVGKHLERIYPKLGVENCTIVPGFVHRLEL